jgi:hypothetical protein
VLQKVEHCLVGWRVRDEGEAVEDPGLSCIDEEEEGERSEDW